MQPMPLFLQDRGQAVLDPAIEHVVGRLVDQAGRAHSPQQPGGFARLLRAVVGDAGIEGFALAHRLGQRAHRLLQRSLGIEAMRIKDVHVVQAHAAQALLEAGQQVLARTPFAVRPGPHQISGFGRDDQFVTVRPEFLAQDVAEVFFGRPRAAARSYWRDRSA